MRWHWKPMRSPVAVSTVYHPAAPSNRYTLRAPPLHAHTHTHSVVRSHRPTFVYSRTPFAIHSLHFSANHDLNNLSNGKFLATAINCFNLLFINLWFMSRSCDPKAEVKLLRLLIHNFELSVNNLSYCICCCCWVGAVCVVVAIEGSCCWRLCWCYRYYYPFIFHLQCGVSVGSGGWTEQPGRIVGVMCLCSRMSKAKWFWQKKIISRYALRCILSSLVMANMVLRYTYYKMHAYHTGYS